MSTLDKRKMEQSSQLNKTSMFWSPRIILSGVGAIENIGVEVRRLKGRKVLIVTDEGISKAGLVKKTQEILKSEELEMGVFDKVESEPHIRTVELCTSVIKGGSYDLVVGLGGGSSMDVAKTASVAVTNEASLRSYLGMDRIPKPGLPKILVPTTAGTGSEVSRAVILIDEKNGVKVAVYSPYLLADTAIIDPSMTLTMPPDVTVDTGMDALVHAVEAYLSLNANLHTDALALQAIKLIADNLAEVFANGKNIEARYNMSMASLMAGMAFTGAGLGAVHALAYPLATECHFTHGRSNAVMLPYVMEFNKISNFSKFAAMAEAMGEKTQNLCLRGAAGKAIVSVKELMENLGILGKLRDYGIPKEALPKLAEAGFVSGKRLLPNNPRAMHLEDAKEIYERAYDGRV